MTDQARLANSSSYYVIDQQLAAFARLTPLLHQEWVDVTTKLTLL